MKYAALCHNVIVSLSADVSFVGKVLCEVCGKACKGQAIRLGDKYFHIECFKCFGEHCCYILNLAAGK